MPGLPLTLWDNWHCGTIRVTLLLALCLTVAFWCLPPASFFFFSSSFTIILFPRTLDLLLGSANLVLQLNALYGNIKPNPTHCLPLKRKMWCFCEFPLLFISPVSSMIYWLVKMLFLSTQNTHNRCLWQRLSSLLLGSWALEQEKAEHGYDSGAFVHLVQCMGYCDPKKVNKVKPRSPNQQNINVLLEAVHQPSCFPCPVKCHSH